MISSYKYHVYHINRYKKVFKLIQKCNVNARFIWAEKILLFYVERLQFCIEKYYTFAKVIKLRWTTEVGSVKGNRKKEK